ncbi:hypothetical protein HDV01_001729 [Terramyces sp. JEL0728]|nr:hypothetical protein HDV01_001729 [Terramyces sp. JEL0728]
MDIRSLCDFEEPKKTNPQTLSKLEQQLNFVDYSNHRFENNRSISDSSSDYYEELLLLQGIKSIGKESKYNTDFDAHVRRNSYAALDSPSTSEYQYPGLGNSFGYYATPSECGSPLQSYSTPRPNSPYNQTAALDLTNNTPTETPELSGPSKQQKTLNEILFEKWTKKGIDCFKSSDPAHYSRQVLSDLNSNPYLDQSVIADVAKVGHYFLDWQIDVAAQYNDEFSLLTQGYKLELSSLEAGTYTVGTSRYCALKVLDSVLGSPSCPENIGVITSYGEGEKKYLTLAKDFEDGGKSFLLESGFVYYLTKLITLEVYKDNYFRIFDQSRSVYTDIMRNPPDLFFPYNPNLIFIGESANGFILRVNFYGRDLMLDMEYNSNTNLSAIIYTDPLAKLQRVYPVRAIDLVKISQKKFILNFNYSYATNSQKSILEINCISQPMLGGINPLYF